MFPEQVDSVAKIPMVQNRVICNHSTFLDHNDGRFRENMAITSASFAYDEGIKQHGRGNRVWTRRSAHLHGFMYLWCKRGLRVVGVGVGRLQWLVAFARACSARKPCEI